MSNALVSRALLPQNLDEAIKFAEFYSRSGMIPADYQGKPANVLVAINWGLEVGISPLSALKYISLVNGRPAIWGDGLLAICQNHPQYLGIEETSEGEGQDYKATCVVKRENKNGDINETIQIYSYAKAQRAGLLTRQTWKQYPERMMQLRARGFALRDAFADAVAGIITAEEAQDMPPMKTVPVQPQPAPSGPTIAERAMAAIEPPQEAVEAPQAPPEPVEGFALRIPGKPTQSFSVQMDFADAYNDLLLKVRRARSLPEAERRTKMKALEEANADTFSMLDEDLAKELHDKRLQYNAGLGAEEKEAPND
jgi:hypothetical protein